MDTETIELVTPVTTFVLGSALTLAVKSFEHRRGVVRTAAQEAMRPTKDWYVQIHTLLLVEPSFGKADALNTGIFDYMHNRLILPHFLFHLSVLRNNESDSTGFGARGFSFRRNGLQAGARAELA